ncbi:hypothetical protein [Rhizobium chutanense]|uniref:Uncharacterized protein n=1 Tax=Rhizobium chutanense TaxID=2035448 RepID=A0A432NL22_9HYPH|nr:hypothetical protein [Rhizobium chutanense]RUM00194.1 hypothetical protein EFR84_25335 [Rhizobium chutanense]
MKPVTAAIQSEYFEAAVSEAVIASWGFLIEAPRVLAMREDRYGWLAPALSESSIEDFDTPTRANVFHIAHIRSLKRLMNDIDRFAQRTVDWDGDDGVPPTAAAVLEAKSFLSFLSHSGCLPQNTYAPGDGEINFEWRAAKRFTEVGFSGDGMISWFHRDAHQEFFSDEPFDKCNISKNLQLLKVLGVEDEHG